MKKIDQSFQFVNAIRRAAIFINDNAATKPLFRELEAFSVAYGDAYERRDVPFLLEREVQIVQRSVNLARLLSSIHKKNMTDAAREQIILARVAFFSDSDILQVLVEHGTLDEIAEVTFQLVGTVMPKTTNRVMQDRYQRLVRGSSHVGIANQGNFSNERFVSEVTELAGDLMFDCNNPLSASIREAFNVLVTSLLRATLSQDPHPRVKTVHHRCASEAHRWLRL